MKYLSILISLIYIIPCFAQNDPSNPEIFFFEEHIEFPEQLKMNQDFTPEVAKYLMESGIPITTTYFPNVSESFDVYFPMINWPTQNPLSNNFLPHFNAGPTHLPYHDSFHHWAGTPGIRLEDILPENIEETKRKLIDVLFHKEYFATAVSSKIHIPAFTKWRLLKEGKAKDPNFRLPADFDEYNQGMMSGFAPLDNATSMEVIRSYVYGDTSSFKNLVRKKLSSASMKRTRELGIPTFMPDLTKFVGSKLDSKISMFFQQYIFPLFFRNNKFAYKGFLDYCETLAEISTQKWLVQWSEDFNYGIRLDELYKRTDLFIDQLVEGKPLTDPGIGKHTNIYVKSWDKNKLRTSTALLGRRIRQAIEYTPDSEVARKLQVKYEDAIRLNRNITEHASFNSLSKSYKNLVTSLKLEFPLKKVYPHYLRNRSINYHDFWANEVGTLENKVKLTSGFYAPSNINEFFDKKKYEKVASNHNDKVYTEFSQKYLKYIEGKDKQFPLEKFESNRSTTMGKYVESLKFYIEKSFLPQLINSKVSSQDKKKIYEKSLEVFNFYEKKILSANEINQKIYLQDIDLWVRKISDFLKSDNPEKLISHIETGSRNVALNYEIDLNLKYSNKNGQFHSITTKNSKIDYPVKYVSIIDFIGFKERRNGSVLLCEQYFN